MQNFKKFLNTMWSIIWVKIMVVICILMFIASIFFNTIYPIMVLNSVKDAKVIGITASNNRKYTLQDVIYKSDFTVTLKYDNDKQVKTSNFYIDKDKIDYVGETTLVTVYYKEDENINCSVEVKNIREEITRFSCGSPQIDSVQAVLYSNGEMCFEGQGDIAKYDEYNYPWLEYLADDENDIETYPIRSISFEDTITPTNIDTLFFNISTLEYCDAIPKTVESMECTFSGCVALKEGADWSQCTNLYNIRNAYSDCTSLIYAPSIPETVIYSDYAFANCDSLENAPDMTNSTNLLYSEYMFQGAEHLVNCTAIAPNIISISGMFADCINLKKMPEVPNTTVYMDEAFKNCISMTNPTIVPAKVITCKSCFEGCKSLTGQLWIDAEPNEESFENFIFNAVQINTLNLDGNSRMLDVLANTSQNNPLISVNGRPVNPAMLTRALAIPTVVDDGTQENNEMTEQNNGTISESEANQQNAEQTNSQSAEGSVEQ